MRKKDGIKKGYHFDIENLRYTQLLILNIKVSKNAFIKKYIKINYNRSLFI